MFFVFVYVQEGECLPEHAPADATVHKLVNSIRTRARLSLFGVDVIVDKRDQTCYAIDLNVFPCTYVFSYLYCNYIS